MERRIFRPDRPTSPAVGYSRAVRVGPHVQVAGTAPIMPDEADPPPDAVRAGQALPRDRRSPRSPSSAPRPSTSCARARTSTHADDFEGGRPRTRRGRSPTSDRPARWWSSAACSIHAGWWRSKLDGAVASTKQIFPPTITGTSFAEGGSVLDHNFGEGEPYTLGVEEEYMLLDGETFDLVQHVETVLARDRGRRARADRINARADAVRARDRDAGLQLAGRGRRASCASCARYVTGIATERGLRVGSAGTHPFQPLRAPAHHRPRPLPAPRRPAPVRRAARADLRAAHPRRGRRPGEGDQGRERPPRPPLVAARALGELAVLARRADGPRLEPADGLRRVPPLGPAAPLPRLRRLRRGRRPAREDRAASPTTPTSGGTSACTRASAPSRSGSATPSRESRTRSRWRRSARRS